MPHECFLADAPDVEEEGASSDIEEEGGEEELPLKTRADGIKQAPPAQRSDCIQLWWDNLHQYLTVSLCNIAQKTEHAQRSAISVLSSFCITRCW